MSRIRNSCSSFPRIFSVWSQDFYLLYTKFISGHLNICSQFSYYVTISNHCLLRSVTVFSFTFSLQMSGFRHLLLFSEAISLHSLLGCNWTSGHHQLTSVDWSQFGRRHLITTSVYDVATSMVLYDVATSSTHIDGQRRAGKMFKTCNSNHQAEKTRLLLSLPLFSSFKSTRLEFFNVL